MNRHLIEPNKLLVDLLKHLFERVKHQGDGTTELQWSVKHQAMLEWHLLQAILKLPIF